MPAAPDSAECPIWGTDHEACDSNTVDLVKRLLVSGVNEDASAPRVCNSIEIWLPPTVDIDSSVNGCD